MAVTMSPKIGELLAKKSTAPAPISNGPWVPPAKPTTANPPHPGNTKAPPTDYMQHPSGKKLTAQQVVGNVEVSKKISTVSADGNPEVKVVESSTDHVVHPALAVPEQAAVVSVTGSRTINLGNYNSVKIGVSLSMPCAPHPKTINETYDIVGDWVSQKLTEASKANGG